MADSTSIDEGLGCLFMVFLVAAVSYLAWPSGSGDTRYFAACEGKKTCVPVLSIRYIVSAQAQTVVEQIGAQPPTRFSGCVVVDEDNWSCTDGGVVRSRTAGVYSASLAPLTTLQEVSRTKWRVLQVLGGLS